MPNLGYGQVARVGEMEGQTGLDTGWAMGTSVAGMVNIFVHQYQKLGAEAIGQWGKALTLHVANQVGFPSIPFGLTSIARVTPKHC